MNTRNKIQKTLQHNESDINEEKSIEKVKNSIPGFFLTNTKFAWVVFVGIMIMGALSLTTIPVELQPEIKIPGASITVVYPGASPEAIEELIINKVETAVENIDDLDEYTSSANVGVGTTVVQFTEGVDIKEKIDDIKSEIDSIKSDLPTDAEDPLVIEFDFSDQPIVILSLLGSGYSQNQLYLYAQELEDRLESISEVSKVNIAGGQKRAFEIIVNTQRLEELGINVTDVSNALSSNNFNFALGNIQIGEFYYSVTQDGEYIDTQDIAAVPITLSSGRVIQIKDVARVIDGSEETYGESFVGRVNEGVKSSVSLTVFKKEGKNIVNLADKVNGVLEEASTDGSFPDDIEFFTTLDLSDFIREDFTNLGQSALFTIVVVFFVLLFVGWKEAIIASLSIPMSFFITFIVLNSLGYTLNNITLFSLILALGLLVDTAIVIVEGCHEYINKGYKGQKAAFLALRDYQSSLISGTLTTVAAFVPMLFMTGTVGQFIRVIPLTITIVLLSSLFVALTFNTFLGSILLKPSKKNTEQYHKHNRRPIFDLYRAFIKNLILKTSSRVIFLLVITALFGISVFGVTRTLQTEFFPQSDLDYFSLSIEAPKDIDLAFTMDAVKKVENILLGNQYLESFTMDVGSQSFGNTHTASAEVTLIKDRRDDKGNKVRMLDVIKSVQQEVKSISGVKIIVDKPNIGPPVAKPINIRLLGNDYSLLSNSAKEILKKVETVKGVSDPDINLRYGAGEFTIVVDREQAIKKGLSPASIAQNIRFALQGTSATELLINNEDVSLIVKAEDNEFESIDDIQSLAITNVQGERIQVQEVAKISLGSSVSSINHRNGSKIVEVYSFIEGTNDDGKDFTSAEVLKNIQNTLELSCASSELQTTFEEKGYESISNDLKEYKKINSLTQFCVSENMVIEFGGEEEETAESFASLGQAALFGFLLIVGILVLQFNSFAQPLIVMVAFLLGLIGVFPGLKLVGATLSFPTFIGIASLLGISVNDAIILISKMNQNRANKMPLLESIIEAGVSRWKPIIITTLSTAAGLLPLVFVDVFYAYLSWAVIFGIMSATTLSMFVIPVLYYMLLPKRIRKTIWDK